MNDISFLEKEFKDFAELQSYANKQFKQIKKLSEKIKDQQEEIIHLKKLLANTVPSILETSAMNFITKSNEQAICEMEIKRLQDVAMTRPLTLEETKKFDLFVKNLVISKESAKDLEAEYKHLPDENTKEKLLLIASLPNKD